MKKVKFIVAIMGFTIATFVSMKTFAVRTPNNSPDKCVRTGVCGYTESAETLIGRYE